MAKETKNNKDNKKENNSRHFWKDFKAELKKVIWPTPKQVTNNTTAVITIVLITAVLVFVLDVAFEKLNTQGIDRLRSMVTSEEAINETVTDESNDLVIGDGNEVEENNASEENAEGETVNSETPAESNEQVSE